MNKENLKDIQDIVSSFVTGPHVDSGYTYNPELRTIIITWSPYGTQCHIYRFADNDRRIKMEGIRK